MLAGEAFGLTAGAAALHVDDLPVAQGQHLIALDSRAAGLPPLRRSDDLVADLRELGLHLDPPVAALLDLKLENLTGLVGTVSDRRRLPPQMAVRDAAPLRVLGEQRSERPGVAAVERFGSCAQLVDHRLSMAAVVSLR